MCNEAKSLPAWPRKLARWTMLAAAVTFAVAAASAAGQRNARGDDDIRAASDSEPIAPKVSLDKAAGLLDAVALDWTNRRQFGTRHTNYAQMISRPAVKGPASPAALEVRAFFEDRVAHWDDPKPGAKPKWDTEVVATAAALALNDALSTGKLHPATRKAFDRAWTLQKPDDSWT